MVVIKKWKITSVDEDVEKLGSLVHYWWLCKMVPLLWNSLEGGKVGGLGGARPISLSLGTILERQGAPYSTLGGACGLQGGHWERHWTGAHGPLPETSLSSVPWCPLPPSAPATLRTHPGSLGVPLPCSSA